MIKNLKYKNKKFLVLGLGKTGKSMVDSLISSEAIVYAWDDKCYNDSTILSDVPLLNPMGIEDNNIDYLALSPGIPLHSPIIEIAKKNNIKIISDIEILYESQKSSKFIGITGTNGKSTTTMLLNHILKGSSINCQVGGNIGIPVLKLNPFSTLGTFILETSSFQLDLINNVKFNISVLLNITPDHTDHHGSLQNYISAKCKIFNKQNIMDWAIISIDNPITKKIYDNFSYNSQKIPISTKIILERGVTVLEERIIFNLHDHKGEIRFTAPLFLPGIHNRENIAAAFAVGLIYNISPQTIINQINSFSPLPHRMELLGDYNNIYYYNDSKATNAEASIAALSTFNNIFWIVGGKAKEGGISSLVPYFGNIKKAYLIGETSADFAEFLTKNNTKNKISYTLDQAIRDATNDAFHAQKPAYIILSPACASYDQFKDFEERGELFRKLFEELKKN